LQTHNALLMSILRSTPNHTPLKYRCLIKISNQIRPTYVSTLVYLPPWYFINPITLLQKLPSEYRMFSSDTSCQRYDYKLKLLNKIEVLYFRYVYQVQVNPANSLGQRNFRRQLCSIPLTCNSCDFTQIAKASSTIPRLKLMNINPFD
jgi:hypothetical protein